ncbi:MAG TPA: RNA polymerase sigma factor [Reyranellaceae bacterium]|nr:RNA polymerase sigma factor [Reyranellaceae bacterium]
MNRPDSQDSSSQGLEQVYLDHRDALVRFLRARGAGDSAEDLIQELWLKISASARGPIADPLGYLYRAANNLMTSHYRSAKRAERREEEWGNAAADRDLSADVAAIAARQELVLAERRLRELGQRVLRVFVLFRVRGVPQREIASQLGISLSSVEKDLQRAYRAIATLRSDIDAG